MKRGIARGLATLAMLALFGAILVLPTGCRRPRDGSDGSSSRGPVSVVPPSDTTLTDAEDVPGVKVNVLAVDGSGGDSFHSGDRVAVTFTVKRDDGSDLPITELNLFEAHISGPTNNYQRVIDETEVVRGGIIAADADLAFNDDNSYTYTFVPLPDNYLDPPNSAGTFTGDVLSGTPLVGGTYTFVFIAYKNYTAGTRVVKDVANVAQDFLFGDATVIEPRAVVAVQNCNKCHNELQMHSEGLPGGGIVRDTRLCVTCHVAGAEDVNDPALAGGTPDVTVEFKVMIHRIHNGFHLPSYYGIATNPDGSRNMLAVPKDFEMVNDEGEIRNFNQVTFPVWPNYNVAMPRDYGYTLSSDPATTPLAAYVPPVDAIPTGGAFGTGDSKASYTSPLGLNGRTWQANDTSTRTGVTNCAKCHGDPDGAGPMEAPAQGDLHKVQPSRRSCGACHDDVDFSQPYRSNLKTMPPQPDDSHCIECHVEGGGGSDPTLFVKEAHVHPLEDPAQFPAPYNGLHVNVLAATPYAGTTLDPGETLSITFTITNDAGENVPIPVPGTPLVPSASTWGGLPFGTGSGYPWSETQSGWWSTMSLVVSGPTNNYNMMDAVDFPTDMPGLNFGVVPNIGLANEGQYTMNVPQYLVLDDFGNSAGVAGTKHGHAFGAGWLPIYNSLWNVTDFREVTADAAAPVTTTAAAASAGQNFIDVTHTVPGFATKDYIRLDCTAAPACTGATREFLRVGYVEVISPTVDRLWFSSPYQTRNLLASSTSGFGSLYGPWLRKSHVSGVGIAKVTLTARALTTAYTIDPSLTPNMGTGQITEVAGFTTGPILGTFMTDWVVPTYYPPAAFGGSDLDETFGAWYTKPVVPGTYTVGLWTRLPWQHKTDTSWPDWSGVISKPWTGNIDYGYVYEVDSYGITSPPVDFNFLLTNSALPSVPIPTEVMPFAEISSFDNCLRCHNDILFHGGSRRQLGTCILCHGTSGIGLHQNYVAAPAVGAPPWDRGLKNTVNFRYFLHNIHAEGSDVVGEDGDEPGGFPGMPNRTQNCALCHGEKAKPEDVAVWEIPHDRDHPTAQVRPVREWMNSCGGCHTKGDATAHFDLMTSPAGEESCGTCHNVGGTYGVGIMHKVR